MAKKKSAEPTPAITTDTNAPAANRRRRAAAPKAQPESPIAEPSTADDRADVLGSAAVIAPSSNGGPTYEQIAEAAYLRYLRRGGGDGRDFDDWVEAEQELKSR